MTPSRLDRTDLVLVALGVVGFALFFLLLPRQHPDAAGSFGIGAERAVEAAEAFLQRSGYEVPPGARVSARLARERGLLDSLQLDLGRPAAIRALREGAREVLPTHHWLVEWRRGTGGPANPDPAGDRPFAVRLTAGGEPWALANTAGVLPRAGVDRAALRAAFGGDDADVASMLKIPADSVLGAMVYFDLPEPVAVEAGALPSVAADVERFGRAATTGQPQGLSAGAAAAIAEVHLRETALAALPLEVTAVEPISERGAAVARVRFATAEPVLGQRAEAAITVTAGGALLALDPEFNGAQGDEPAPGTLRFGESGAPVREAAKWVGYALLLIVLIVVLLRRLSARVLDAPAALKDAVLAALLIVFATVLSIPYLQTGFNTWWVIVLLVGLGSLFWAAGVGVLTFIASGASDALAREHWPRAIRTLSLVRQSAWINEPVGRALVRGVGLGGAVLGGAVLALWLFPHSYLPHRTARAFVESENTLSLVGTAVGGAGWYALVLVLAAFLGLGALLRKWRPAAVVPGLTLALAVLQVEVVRLPVGTPAVSWGVALAVGLGLAWAFWQTDALTVLVGLFAAGIVWGTAEGLLVAGSPAWLDHAIAVGLVVGIAGVGVAGLRSGRAAEALPTYEPDFVVEQRERGRLQRELEIAREVQRSFLPERVPEVPGLDIAARCVPAEEVGGDYYDLLPLGPGRLALVVGDVSGKGIQAAFYMTLVKGFLQSLAPEVGSPAEVLRRVNRLFRANAPRGTFVSLIYGVVDLSAGTFTFARAGHNPLIVRCGDAGADVQFLQPPGLAVGMPDPEAFDRTIHEEAIGLRPGDTLVFYTDGFSEAMDGAHDVFSDERLADVVADAPGSAADLLDAVITDVRAYAAPGGLHDDMTMVVVRVATRTDGQPRRVGPAAITPATVPTDAVA